MATENKVFPDKYIDEIEVDLYDNYFTKVWNDVCSEIQFKSLLDVGCGNGVFTATLKRSVGCQLSGVDGSSYALEKAKSHGFDEVELIGDFNSNPLPFGPERFDCVVCKDVLEHLHAPEFLLEEINRVLKRKGFLLVHVPNHFSLYGRIIFLFSNNMDTFCYFRGAKPWNFPHIRFFTYESLSELLQVKGFKIKKNLSHHFFSFPYRRFIPMKSIIAKFLTRMWPSQFAEGFTIVCQKI